MKFSNFISEEAKRNNSRVSKKLLGAMPSLEKMNQSGGIRVRGATADEIQKEIEKIFNTTSRIAPPKAGGNPSSQYDAILFVDPEDGLEYFVVVAADKSQSAPEGHDWEDLITDKYNLQNKLTPDTSASENAKRFYPTYETYAENIAKDFVQYIGKSPMTQFGKGKSKSNLSKFWSSFGASDGTPKSDMYTKTHNISLKKKGGSQLMSAAKEETIATFHAALEYMGENSPSGVREIATQIEENFDKVATKMTKTALDNLSKGDTSSLSPEDKKAVEKYVSVEAFHKEVNEEIKKTFAVEENEQFKEFFVYEAMSGRKKFEGKTPLAIASCCIEFDANKGSVNKFIPISPDGSSKGLSGPVKVSPEVKSIAKQCTFYTAWKSSSGSPYSTFRINVDSKAKLNESLDSIIREEIRNDVWVQETNKDLLSESMQLDEMTLFKRAISRMRNVVGAVGKFVSNLMGRIFARAKNAIKKIMKMGKNAFKNLFAFLGIELKSARVSAPSDVKDFMFK
jgi:hypothetical protein